jgi:methionine synthase II (cobalamin-independent)
MISYFDQIPGLTLCDGKVGVTGRIHPPSQVEDFQKLKDFAFARRYLQSKRVENTELKAGVTGPTTLGFICASTQLKGYRSIADPELYRDVASALLPLIDELLRLGAYVQIDEPGFSAGFLDPFEAAGLINKIVADSKHFEKGSGRLSVHVCGDLTKSPRVFDALTRVDADILSLAFAGKLERRNLQLLSKDEFLNSGKKLGFGCLSVASRAIDLIEPVNEIARLLNEGIRRIGVERLAYVHPDCGLRNTPLSVTEEILERLRISVEEITHAN